jgi:hypothetical protein
VYNGLTGYKEGAGSKSFDKPQCAADICKRMMADEVMKIIHERQ